MSTQNLLTLTRHEEYYISSADLSILVEHVQFRVHRYFFERESAYFRKELTTPASPGVVPQGSNDSNAFILEGVTSLEFAKFLWVFYNPRYSLYHAPVSDWATILRLANTWLFPHVKHLAVRELEKKSPAELSDVHRIALYHANAVDRNLLVPRYAALCARPEPLTVEEGMALGMETALMIAAGREESRSRLPSGGRSPLELTVRGEELWKVIRELFKIAPMKEEDKLDAEVEVVEKEKEKETPSTTGGLTKAKEADKPTQAPPTPSKAKPAKTPATSTAMATPTAAPTATTPQTAQTPPTPMVPPTPTATTQKGQQPAGTPQPPPQQAQQQQQGKKNKTKNQQSTLADNKKAQRGQTKTEKTPTSTPPSEAAKATEAPKDGGNEGVVPPTPAAGQQEGRVSAQTEAEAGRAGEERTDGETKKESGSEGTDGEKKAAEGEVKTEEAKEEETKKEGEEKTEKTDAPASATAEPAPGDAATTKTTTTTTTATTATTTKDDTPPPPPANNDKKTDTTTTTEPTTSPTASKPPSPIAKSPVNPTTPSTTTNANANTNTNGDTTPAPTSEPLVNLSDDSSASQDPLDPASPPRPPPKLDTHATRPNSLASANSAHPSSANANANVSSPSLINEISVGLGFGSIWGQQGTPQSANKTSGGGGSFQWGLGGGYPN